MSGTVARRGNNMHRNITVTPFLNKLYNMVDDSASDNLIGWSDDGNSFIVYRHEDFAKDVLPRFFKHSNFSSFVRQLNMYGFHKVPHLQQGGLIADAPDADSWEFSNDNFQRGQPDLLHFIRRKKGHRDNAAATTATGVDAEAEFDDDADDGVAHTTDNGVKQEAEESVVDDPPQKQVAKSGSVAGGKTRASRPSQVDMARILKEIQVIRDHQLTISSDIKRLQQENQNLWIQATETEQNSKKQQDTVDKILRFLATVFSADMRQSEIQLPLRRLISHNADSAHGSASSSGLGESASRNGAHSTYSGHQFQTQQPQSQQNQRVSPYQSVLEAAGILPSTKMRNLMSTPRTQSIFEEMDFPEIAAATANDPSSQIISSEDLNSLVMSLANSSAPLYYNNSNNNGIGTDVGLPATTGLANSSAATPGFGYAHFPEQQASDPLVGKTPAAGAVADMPNGSASFANGMPDLFGNINQTFTTPNNNMHSLQLILEAIKTLTPEQQQSMLNYFRLTGQLNHMPLLTAGSTTSSNHVDSPGNPSVNTTPFLEFVDPNAEPVLDGINGLGTGLDNVPGLNIDNLGNAATTLPVAETADDHYEDLFKDPLNDGSTISSSLNEVNIPGIDPAIAASLFQTPPVLTSTPQPTARINANPNTAGQPGKK
ncbi:Heat shock transcription factor [Coemansia interrupta]|uniref:Heat shock transcription factor n=1 Tax=Coemansia interrupta TaxID=1126814 RepID=A0A9W8HL55_9FUNG|nr:Heat shock transcription factor [Coemansia interrupta]